MVYSPLLGLAGFLGLTGVIAGAFGAHGLSNYPEAKRNIFRLAAHYQMLHSMAALGAIALAEALRPTKPSAAKMMDVAASLLLAGTTLFSGTIYATTLGAPKVLGPLTPLGGLVMMGGWGTVIVAAFML